MNSGRATLDDFLELPHDVIEIILSYLDQKSQVNAFLQTSKKNLESANLFRLMYARFFLNCRLDRHDFLPILRGNARITRETLLGGETLDANYIKILIQFEELVNFQVYSRDNKEEFIAFLASREAQGVNSIGFWQTAMCLFFIVCGQPVRSESERQINFITSESLDITKTFFRELVKINPLTHLPYYKAMFEDTGSAFDNIALNNAAKRLLAHLECSGLPSLSSQLETWLNATLFRSSHTSLVVKKFSSLITKSALEEMGLDFSALPPEESAYKKNLIQNARFKYDRINTMAICKEIFSMSLNCLHEFAQYVPSTPNLLKVLNPPLFYYQTEFFSYCDRSLRTVEDKDSQRKFQWLKQAIGFARRIIFENNVLFHANDIKIRIYFDPSSLLDTIYRLTLSHPGLSVYLYSYAWVYLSFKVDFKDEEKVAARFLKTMKELGDANRGLVLFVKQHDSFHFGRCVSDIVEFLPRIYNLSPQFLELYLLFLQSDTRTMALDKSSRFFFLLFKEWVDPSLERLAREHIDDHSLFRTDENRMCIVQITEIIAELCSKHLAAPPFSLTEIMSPRSFLWKIPLKDILSWLSDGISKDASKNKMMLLLYLVSRNRSRLDWSFFGLNFLKLSGYNIRDTQEKSSRSIPFLHILLLLPDKLLEAVIAKIKENIQRNALPIADLEHVPGFQVYVKGLRENFGVFKMSLINKLVFYAFIFQHVFGEEFEALHRSYFIFAFPKDSSSGNELIVKSIPRGDSTGGIALSDLVFTILKADDQVKFAHPRVRLIELIIRHPNDPDFIEFICQANDLEPASLIKKVDQYFYKRFSPKTANSEAAAAVSHTSEKPAEEVVSPFEFPFMTFAPNATKPNPAPSPATSPDGAAVTQFEFPPLPSLHDFTSSLAANEQPSSSPAPAWMAFGKK